MVEAERILADRQVYDDGKLVEVEIYRIDDPDQFPSGYKYSFQYCDPGTGRTILRYDNAHEYNELPTRHHKHQGDDVTSLDYPGDIEELHQTFQKKVVKLREH